MSEKDVTNGKNISLDDEQSKSDEILFGGSYGGSYNAGLPGFDISFYYRCPVEDCIYQCFESTRSPDSPPKCPDHDRIMKEVNRDECG